MDILQQAMLLKQTKEEAAYEIAQLKIKLADSEKKLVAEISPNGDKEIVID